MQKFDKYVKYVILIEKKWTAEYCAVCFFVCGQCPSFPETKSTSHPSATDAWDSLSRTRLSTAFERSKYKIARRTNSICPSQDTYRGYEERLR